MSFPFKCPTLAEYWRLELLNASVVIVWTFSSLSILDFKKVRDQTAGWLLTICVYNAGQKCFNLCGWSLVSFWRNNHITPEEKTKQNKKPKYLMLSYFPPKFLCIPCINHSCYQQGCCVMHLLLISSWLTFLMICI